MTIPRRGRMLPHRMKTRITLTAVLLSGLVATARDLTFFHVSDTHYGLSAPGDAAMTRLVDAMNALPGTAYPTNFGGKVAAPRGVGAGFRTRRHRRQTALAGL